VSLLDLYGMLLRVLIKEFQFGFEPFLREIVGRLNIKSLHYLQFVDKTSFGARIEHIKSGIDVPWAIEYKDKRNGGSSIRVLVLITVENIPRSRVGQRVCNIFQRLFLQSIVNLYLEFFLVYFQNES